MVKGIFKCNFCDTIFTKGITYKTHEVCCKKCGEPDTQLLSVTKEKCGDRILSTHYSESLNKEITA